MALTREQIKTAALELEPAERSALAEELLLSIGDTDRDQLDAAWLKEAHRRDAAFSSGHTGGKSVDEAIASIRTRSK